MRLSVELCAIYWHFLLLVWLVLFGLLLAGDDLVRLPPALQAEVDDTMPDHAPDDRRRLDPARRLARLVADWSSDQRAFKNVSWGKAMMWIFLLSDTFVFSCFLLSYMTVRMSTTVPWPNPSEVFALKIGGTTMPLILIAIMTFVLISSSGTMAMAVNFGYRRDRVKTAILMLATALFGATFVGMQAFEWTKLITEGVRPWGNPWGAPQFGSAFFMITGFHGTHVTIGVIFLLIIARKVWRGDFDQAARGLFHQPQGPLRDRRDHRPLLALRRSGLGLHLRPVLSLVRTGHGRSSGIR